MQKIVSIKCPKCNNIHNFYRYGKDELGYQKYKCRKCNHQFAPERPRALPFSKYPLCPRCRKSAFLHHDYIYYSNFRCNDRDNCNHSFFIPKGSNIKPASQSHLPGKMDFSRMRFPAHIIISALSMFYIGKSSLRNISFMLKLVDNISVSHTTISNWCRKFAPMFNAMSVELISALDFNSDEWHADETVVKINGKKHYIWFVVDSETRFVLGYHLSPHRNSEQAFSLLNSVSNLGDPGSIVSDRYSDYIQAAKAVLSNSEHIRVESFKADISNNIIESFNHQFKAWYKTKQGFNSFESANNLISMFVFFYNFVRPHSSLNGKTPAQVAGLNLTKKQKRKYLIVA